MWRDWLTGIGLVVEFSGAAYYLWTIPKGDTRPQPITWGGWTAIGAVGAWATRSAGGGLSFYIAASFVIVTGGIFAMSLIPGYGHKGTDKTQPTDLPILIAGILLLTLRSLNYGSAGLHATLAVCGDTCFAWYTLRKSWNYPETENLSAWLMATAVAAVGVIVLGSFSYAAAAFPIYLLAGNGAIGSALLVKRLNKPSRTRIK